MSTVSFTEWVPGCNQVLRAVVAERERQVAQYGLNSELEDGTGPDETWVQPLDYSPATVVQKRFRKDYEGFIQPTWARLVREEVAEAFEQDDPQRLEEELIQVAALCISWVETLRYRR